MCRFRGALFKRCPTDASRLWSENGSITGNQSNPLIQSGTLTETWAFGPTQSISALSGRQRAFCVNALDYSQIRAEYSFERSRRACVEAPPRSCATFCSWARRSVAPFIPANTKWLSFMVWVPFPCHFHLIGKTKDAAMGPSVISDRCPETRLKQQKVIGQMTLGTKN